MAIVAQTYRHVMGADTHARNNTVAIIDTSTGAVIGSRSFPTTAAGLARAVRWGKKHDSELLAVVEGIGSYGATLARAADQAGLTVVEPSTMPARQTGKDDGTDAIRIARSVLGVDDDKLRQPRLDDGERAALRVVVAARDHMTRERTAAVNALTALVRRVRLGVEARHPLSCQQIGQIARWRGREEPIDMVIARAEAIRLATRVTALDDELGDNINTMKRLLSVSPAAVLLDETGIGPVTAAVAYTAWSHAGRVRSEAGFAKLAGVCPIPASSGNTVRHRLNRGGDRRLNQALHMAAITRMTHHPETRVYVQRRTEEGLTNKEIRRCVKRYLARRIYRALNSASSAALTCTTT